MSRPPQRTGSFRRLLGCQKPWSVYRLGKSIGLTVSKLVFMLELSGFLAVAFVTSYRLTRLSDPP
jgi:hypothetical protein